MKKLLIIFFSSNRLEFLKPTLESVDILDFQGFEVTKLLVDDYPLRRNDAEFYKLAEKHGINVLHLHKENKGITGTWTEMWNEALKYDFDYLFMHEDDAVHTVPIKISDITDLLDHNPKLAQVQFGRDAWYEDEESPSIINYRPWREWMYEVGTRYFWMMSSICTRRIVKECVENIDGPDMSEGVVSHHVSRFGLTNAIIRDKGLNSLIDHIGVYFQGKRITQAGDPGWDKFQSYQTGIQYCSKTGKILNGPS